MIDIAKVADLVLMLIDITFGIEMEVFEFLEICRAHGTPKIMGVLNHIDVMKDNKSLKKQKKALKQRFQVELYPGAKLFYLTGMIRDEYMLHEVKNLSRFIAVSKFRPLTFRSSHPYVVVDRWEDLTDAEALRNTKCDRDVVLYGYVRGATLKPGQQKVHIPGCGDFVLDSIQFLPDPCPLPSHEKKRSLTSEEHLLYAPFSGVGGVVYDKDAVYIDLGGSQHGRYIKEQQEKEKKLLQQQFVQSGVTVSIITLVVALVKSVEARADQDDEDDDHDEGNADEDSDNDEEAEDDDNEGAVQLMSRLQRLSASAADGTRRVQLFAGGEHIISQRPEPRYNNPGAGGLPSFESVVDQTGRVRRRALIPENEEYRTSGGMADAGRGPAPAGGDDDNSSDENDSIDDDSEEGDQDDKEIESDGDEQEDMDNDENDEVKSDDESDTEVLPKKRKAHVSFFCWAAHYKLQDSGVINTNVTSKKKPKLEGTDAFSKIQSVLQSLEEDEEGQTSSGTDDVGYASGDVGTSGTADPDDEDEGDEENDGDDEYQRLMFEEARQNYFEHQSDPLTVDAAVYGDELVRGYGEEEIYGGQGDKPRVPVADEDDDDGFLQRVEVVKTIYDERDSSCRKYGNVLREWKDDYSAEKDSIKDCFVTGKWKDSEDAQTLLKLDQGDLYGDFEDLETGTKFQGEDDDETDKKDSAADEFAAATTNKSENSRKQRIIEKKKKIKARLLENEMDSNTDYFDSWKADMAQQAELNRTEFESLSDEVRVQYEGFRAGMYVRLRFKSLPCEFVINFDPTYPLIVGGLKEEESMNVYNRVRMKVHRWYPKILKNRDPLILSVGWRRLQTMMYYGKREDDLKLRSLKYAKKYLHVEGLFWGPASPVGTGFVAFQSVSDRVRNFRIAANGVLLDNDKSTTMVKKLKLLGHPRSVTKKTAYITNMFHSETEVAAFLGAKIQTQSGIRGLVKASNGLKGDFRAKFEDTIKMSDVVLLKTWTNVEVAKYCSYVRSLLLTPEQKAHWQGMKTVAQVKKEKNIRNEPNKDSLYTEITRRRTYVPQPMKVPRSLQAALPYKYKPKHQTAVAEEERVLVVKDPHEEKMDRFMNRYRELLEEKKKQSKIAMKAKKTKFLKKKKEQDMFRANREKKQKTAACKKYSLKHPKKP
ncbi:hypothetical protein HAZT_HAZT010442 [Hyalella azteca]|uniref:Uncharacterized protein n=1 Tax=Hyalella azteca TaxID=294128 RepID=A0A6A0HCP2_HYAAZ|nr:hypothetical protein HAZT_HAZT010442 [Hyalella azteca]